MAFSSRQSYRSAAINYHSVLMENARVAKQSTTSTKKRCDSSKMELPADETAGQLAKLAWAVAHPARVRIVRLLIGRKTCVCGEIVDEISLAQSTVSQHLKILKESGLVQGEVDGPRVCYCINRDNLRALKQLVAGLK
jgi:ArsR family transcriptional regulator